MEFTQNIFSRTSFPLLTVRSLALNNACSCQLSVNTVYELTNWSESFPEDTDDFPLSGLMKPVSRASHGQIWQSPKAENTFFKVKRTFCDFFFFFFYMGGDRNERRSWLRKHMMLALIEIAKWIKWISTRFYFFLHLRDCLFCSFLDHKHENLVCPCRTTAVSLSKRGWMDWKRLCLSWRTSSL